MNISTDKEIADKKFSFSDHGSPYLSPLHGLSEPSEQFYDQYIPNLDIDPSSPRSQNAEFVYSNNFDRKSNRYFEQIEEESNMNLEIQSEQKNEEDQINQGKKEFKKIQQIPHELQPGNTISLINFLVAHDELTEGELEGFSAFYSRGSYQLKMIFEILAEKFRKLKKTKEEMTKYCMRKAFRFISDYKTNLKNKGKIKTQTEISISKISYQIPFKYIYSDSPQEKLSGEDYEFPVSQADFQSIVLHRGLSRVSKFFFPNLEQIHELIEQDNALKVTAFAESIQKAIINKQFDRIRKWNRLPWTAKILQKTEKLAISLLEYAKMEDNEELPKKIDQQRSI